jgi:hypothetical protein
VIVVSSRGSSKAVGSEKINFLRKKKKREIHKHIFDCGIWDKTDESKIPNDMLIGTLDDSWSGERGVRWQSVWFVSVSYTAFGNVAETGEKERERVFIEPIENGEKTWNGILFRRAAVIANNVASNAFPS